MSELGFGEIEAFQGRRAAGWLEVICGPMFSGKSEELIRRLRRARIARRQVQVFKPTGDTRYSEVEIVSHSDIRMESEPVPDAAEILRRTAARTEVVGIDEANFFGADLTPVVKQLVQCGKQAVVAGLDTDFLGRPFAPMPDLMCQAESITKMLAICACCGRPAGFNQRLVANTSLILLGTGEIYEARCRFCFLPSEPRQEPFDFSGKGSGSLGKCAKHE